jgi:hypothetical protein
VAIIAHIIYLSLLANPGTPHRHYSTPRQTLASLAKRSVSKRALEFSLSRSDQPLGYYVASRGSPSLASNNQAYIVYLSGRGVLHEVASASRVIGYSSTSLAPSREL